MIDTVMIINLVFGTIAVLYGLISRNFGTAVVVGVFVGMIHGGLIALAVLQSGTALSELPFLKDAADVLVQTPTLPYVKDAIDFVAQSGYVVLPPARLTAYLFAGALALMLTAIVFYLVKWVLAGLASAVTPKKA